MPSPLERFAAKPISQCAECAAGLNLPPLEQCTAKPLSQFANFAAEPCREELESAKTEKQEGTGPRFANKFLYAGLRNLTPLAIRIRLSLCATSA